MKLKQAIAALLFGGVIFAGVIAAQTSRSVWDGIYSEAQVARGKAVYSDRCFQCHMRALNGDGEARGLTGDRFLLDWDGESVLSLFDRIKNTMPYKTPGSLSRQQTVDVLAFILYFNGFPAGSSDLGTGAEMMKDVRIQIAKPGSR